MSGCLSERPLNVGKNAEILLRATPQVGAGAPQLEGLFEPLAGRFDRATLEIESAQSVEGLRGQDGVADLNGYCMTPLAHLAGQDRLVSLVVQNSQPAQGLGQDHSVRTPPRGIYRRGVALQCLRYAAATLMGSSFP